MKTWDWFCFCLACHNVDFARSINASVGVIPRLHLDVLHGGTMPHTIRRYFDPPVDFKWITAIEDNSVYICIQWTHEIQQLHWEESFLLIFLLYDSDQGNSNAVHFIDKSTTKWLVTCEYSVCVIMCFSEITLNCISYLFIVVFRWFFYLIAT